jgi:putative acetyltransferase
MPRPPGLTIRRAEPGDFAELARTFEDESAYGGTLQLPFPSAALWKAKLAEPKDGEFLLLALVDGEVAGNAGLFAAGRSPRRSHAMHFGVAVRPEFQGKGVGSALMVALLDTADNWLNVFRIELEVFTDNERAIALYRKHGFEVEGTHRAYALRAGRYADIHSMARLKAKPPI